MWITEMGGKLESAKPGSGEVKLVTASAQTGQPVIPGGQQGQRQERSWQYCGQYRQHYGTASSVGATLDLRQKAGGDEIKAG